MVYLSFARYHVSVNRDQHSCLRLYSLPKIYGKRAPMTGARFPFLRAFFIVSYEHLSQKRPAKGSGAPAERF